MELKKHKFKVNQEVVYHAGNWKYSVSQRLYDGSGDPVYLLRCEDEDCLGVQCGTDYPEGAHLSVHDEKDLIDYDEWCDHTEKDTCKICCN
jgi:hypothetical protein